MKESPISYSHFLVLILAMAFQLESLAQGTPVLVGESESSQKRVSFAIGQTAKYKTAAKPGFQKGVIKEFTDSTITFTRKHEAVVISFRDLKELKALKPGRKGGGIVLIVVGFVGVVVGSYAVGLSGSGVGSGDPGAERLIPLAGGMLMVGGVILLLPYRAKPATLKMSTVP